MWNPANSRMEVVKEVQMVVDRERDNKAKHLSNR